MWPISGLRTLLLGVSLKEKSEIQTKIYPQDVYRDIVYNTEKLETA